VDTTSNYSAFPSDDIRAGTWTISNPFRTIIADGSPISDYVDGETFSCILFTYDRDGDGLIDDNERFGYRLRNDEPIALQVAQDSTAACDDGAGSDNWQNLNDTGIIEITAFNITQYSTPINPPNKPFKVTVHELQLEITGRLVKTVDGSIIERTVRETVRVRNDEVI